MEQIARLYEIFLWISVFCLAVTMCCCLFRAILGPRFTDRVVAVNIVCTKTIILIAILSTLLGNEYLIDIAMVYAMISFLAVLVLSKCYLSRRPPRREHHGEKPQEKEKEYV